MKEEDVSESGKPSCAISVSKSACAGGGIFQAMDQGPHQERETAGRRAWLRHRGPFRVENVAQEQYRAPGVWESDMLHTTFSTVERGYHSRFYMKKTDVRRKDLSGWFQGNLWSNTTSARNMSGYIPAPHTCHETLSHTHCVSELHLTTWTQAAATDNNEG